MTAQAPGPGRTALVTGAASGIGKRAVERYRARGIRVVGGDRSDAVVTMREDDRGFVGVAGDVTDPGYLAELVDVTTSRFGGVDVLFHSAGIMPGGAVADVPTEDILRVMRVNYDGAVLATKAVLPGMRAQGHGEIVLLGSLTGYVPSKGFAAYSASKAALDMFGEILAHEEAENGVQVIVAAPIAVKTPLLAQAHGGPAYIERLSTRSSGPAMITPDKVIDEIERGLARKRPVVLPGGRIAHAARRLSPALTWRLAGLVG